MTQPRNFREDMEESKPKPRGSFKVIKGGLLIDGRGGKPLERGALLLEGDGIRWVGPEKDLALPDGAQATEYSYPGQTILPGLVDVHTHTNLPGDGTIADVSAAEADEILLLRSAMNARIHLESGVTTARDNGAKNRTGFFLKEGIARGLVKGPRMVLSGRPVTITGGHCWFFGSEANGVEGVRAAVRQLIKEGADFIKVMTSGGGTLSSYPFLPSFKVEELKALVEEAHHFGKLVGAHCTCTQAITNSLDAGADMLIHCSFGEPDGSFKYNAAVGERIAAAGAWVNPTIHVGRATLWRMEAKAREGTLTEAEQAQLEPLKRSLEGRSENRRRLIDAGAKMVAGSDAGWNHYPLGQFYHEIEALTHLGMSNMAGIVAGTSEAAESIGMSHLVGSLEPGKLGDVVVVDGNPLRDINALSRVKAVFKGSQQIR